MPTSEQLSVFISYAHEDKRVASLLAAGLVEGGASVWIDEGELRAGDSIIERIATAILDVHFVVAVISDASVESNWCRKELSLAITGGLAREGVKVLPLRLGDLELPPALVDTFYLSVDPLDPAAIVPKLLADARAHLTSPDDQRAAATRKRRARVSSAAGIQIPSPGQADGWGSVRATGYGAEVVRRARQAGITPAEYARSGLRGSRAHPDPPADELDLIRLAGIVREGIGRPMNDGTSGSALYAVPFRLSRVPTSRWARLLEQTWDRPPQFTTMHRPGICRVLSDVVTLDGVTIEEVETYHLHTLKLCVAKVNDEIARLDREDAERIAREREVERQHQAAVDRAIDRLDFD